MENNGGNNKKTPRRYVKRVAPVDDLAGLRLTFDEMNPSPPKQEDIKEEKKETVTKKKKKKKKSWKKKLKWFFLINFILMLVGILVTSIILYKPIKGMLKETNEITSNISLDDFVLASNIHIYDNNGEEMLSVNQEKNIEYLESVAIPEYVKDCFIATEDKRFYSHKGVDFKSLARAAVALVKNDGGITQGGSTITQQLVKLTYLTAEQSFTRKFKEMIIARDLEKQFSKDQVLEFYINNIYFGNNAYGINSAGIEYFGVTADKLSLAQIAYLCAIPNNPTIFDPYSYSKNEDGSEMTYNKSTKTRQELMLANMLAQGCISQEEYDNAVAEEIVLSHEVSENTGYDSRKNFIVSEAVEIIMKENGFKFQYKFASDEERQSYLENYTDVYKTTLNQFYRSGYKIYTSFNETLQERVQAEIDNRYSSDTELNAEGIYAHQVAAIVLDNKTGMIQCMIGGRTSPNTDYLNRAYAIQRQNGSTMKPIAVYAPAIELLGYLPTSVKQDKKIEGGPKNADGAYYGHVTLREALRLSLNTVAYQLYSEVKPSRGLNYLYGMEFESIVPADNNLASGLGGLTIGTNVKEVAGAYATLANHGKFNSPSCITKIETSSGAVVYSHTNQDTQVYESTTAEIMINMLETAATQGTGAGSQFNSSIAVAGKTGTTDDNKDLWFAGSTPLYTAVVWTGYDTPRDITYNVNMQPNKVWSGIMGIVHEGMYDLKFEYDANVKFAWVDDSGLEVPENTNGARYEIFPGTYSLQQNQSAFHQVDKDAYIQDIDNEFNKAKDSKDKGVIQNAIINLGSINREIESSTLAQDIKDELKNNITDKVKQLNENLKKLEASNTDITVSTDGTQEIKDNNMNAGNSFEFNTGNNDNDNDKDKK